MNERLQRMSTSGLLADRKVTQLMGFTTFIFLIFTIFSFKIPIIIIIYTLIYSYYYQDNKMYYLLHVLYSKNHLRF